MDTKDSNLGLYSNVFNHSPADEGQFPVLVTTKECAYTWETSAKIGDVSKYICDHQAVLSHALVVREKWGNY